MKRLSVALTLLTLLAGCGGHSSTPTAPACAYGFFTDVAQPRVQELATLFAAAQPTSNEVLATFAQEMRAYRERLDAGAWPDCATRGKQVLTDAASTFGNDAQAYRDDGSVSALCTALAAGQQLYEAAVSELLRVAPAP